MLLSMVCLQSHSFFFFFVKECIIFFLLISFFSGRYLDVIEKALCCGETVLIENLPEKVDPVLEPLLGRNTVKRGRLVLKMQHYIYKQGKKIYT